MAVTEKTKYQAAGNKQAEQDYRDLMNLSNETERIRFITLFWNLYFKSSSGKAVFLSKVQTVVPDGGKHDLQRKLVRIQFAVT